MLAEAHGQDGLSLLLGAEPRSVPACRGALRSFLAGAGADADVTWRVCLAVNEAVANAVVHAYRHRAGAGGAVVVEASCAAGELVVVVRDDGCGLTPRDDSPGAGVGLLLLHELSDQVSVRTPLGGGTEVTLRFALGDAQRIRSWRMATATAEARSSTSSLA